MRRLPALAAAALLALHAAASADPAVDGGFCIPPRADDCWYETWAEIENTDSTEFRGTLEVSLSYYRGDGPSARRDVAVAPGSKKRFFLVLAGTVGYRAELQIRLKDGKGREAASKKASATWLAGPDKTLVVVARPEQPAAIFSGLATKKLKGGYTAWQVEESHLPEHVEGWSSAGLVALAGVDLAAWSEEQRRSLRAWVELGGQVLLLPGTDRKWLESPGVKQLVDFGKVSEEDAESFPNRYLGKAGPKVVLAFEEPGENVLPAAGNLAKVWPVGRGRVAALTFDANNRELTAEDSGLGLGAFAENLLDALAPAAPPWYEYAESRGTWYWRGFVLALGQELVGYPPTAGILLGLLVYVLAIGPVNFWILRRRHAPALTVVTVPAVGFAVTGLLLLFAFFGRDSAVRVNRLTVLRPGPDRIWEVREHLVAVTGRRQEVLLDSPLGRLTEMTDGRNSAPENQAFGGADGNRFLRRMQPNEPAYFFAIGRRDLGPITATEDGGLTVVNGSRLDIEKAWYSAAGARFMELGAIPSGKSWRGRLVFSAGRSPFTNFRDDSPDAIVLRSLDPQFLKTAETAIVAIVRGGGEPPTVNGAAVRVNRDVTVLIIPVTRGPK